MTAVITMSAPGADSGGKAAGTAVILRAMSVDLDATIHGRVKARPGGPFHHAKVGEHLSRVEDGRSSRVRVTVGDHSSDKAGSNAADPTGRSAIDSRDPALLGHPTARTEVGNRLASDRHIGRTGLMMLPGTGRPSATVIHALNGRPTGRAEGAIARSTRRRGEETGTTSASAQEDLAGRTKGIAVRHSGEIAPGMEGAGPQSDVMKAHHLRDRAGRWAPAPGWGGAQLANSSASRQMSMVAGRYWSRYAPTTW